MNDINTKKITRIPRIFSLDTLRGLKLTNMLQIHFANLWVIPFLKAQLDYMSIIYIIGLPLFIIIPGVSLAISLENRKLRGEPSTESLKHIIKRGFILIFLNQLMNIGAFGFAASWASGIFSLLGFSIIITCYLMRYSKLTRGIIAGIIIGISPVLRLLFIDINDFLGRVGFAAPWTIQEWLKATLIAPGFALFPWIGFVIAGSILGEYLITGIKENNMDEALKKLMIIGAILFPIGLIMDVLKFPTFTIADLNIFNTGNIIWVIGLNCFIIAGFYWIEDIKRVKFVVLDIINLVGRLTLTIFFVHAFYAIIIVEVIGDEQILRMYSFFIIFLLFFVFTYILGELWKRNNFKYSLEWFLGILS
ncbi:MAG: DUF1624 domain-containing protein [Candidatus Helarchaeota archaeon]|nr:DUF1624 domain-containing protein [Candidatus Helarchaeota archaeon]